MKLGVVKETYPGERRVAIVPAVIPALKKSGLDLLVEAGAGQPAGFSDDEYRARGASITARRNDVFAQADLIAQVRTFGAKKERGCDDLGLMRPDQTVLGLADPLLAGDCIHRLSQTGVRSFALELIPRITRAQAMDVLSSQATVAGYKAAVLAAERLPRMFPMMMTAAGTVVAAKAFVVGAGVAGLQAIASARRLGAVVQAYDVRPEVREQVESLGAKFVQFDLQASEGQGGYASSESEEFYRRQREVMMRTVAESDIVITTAAIPGARPPLLITAEMVASMPAGAVVIDLAARADETGGNCELTRPDEIVTVARNNATVLGPTNLPATVPQTASQMFARNVAAFVALLVKNGELKIDMNDQIIAQTLLTEHGEIVNERVKQIQMRG